MGDRGDGAHGQWGPWVIGTFWPITSLLLDGFLQKFSHIQLKPPQPAQGYFYLIFVVSVLFSPCFSEPWNLPFHTSTRVFLLISVQPFNKGEKAVSIVQCGCEFTVINCTVMSWEKASAAVGLAGLTPWEAAKGALLCKDFQKMPDPSVMLSERLK